MRIYFAAAALVLGVSLANADEFFGSITKVDGHKIHVTKGGILGKKGDKPAEPEVLTAAEGCKVSKRGTFDPKAKSFSEEPVEDGLKSKLFKKATVMARITTEENKVTKVVIFNVQSDYEFRAVIRKVEGQKVTFTKLAMFGPGVGKRPEETTLTALDNVKVLDLKKGKDKEAAVVKEGLKSEIFGKSPLVLIVVDDDNKISEIRLNPGPVLGPPPPPPPPPPPTK